MNWLRAGRWALAVGLFVGAFTVIASLTFLALTGILRPPWATWQLWAWFHYLFDYRKPAVVRLHWMSAVPGAAIPSLVWLGLLYKARHVEGWPMRRAVPSRAEASTAPASGNARLKTVREMRKQWPARSKMPWGGIVLGEAMDPTIDTGPFDGRDKRTWGHGGRKPLLIYDATDTPHFLICAGSGKWKTTGHAIPNLVRQGWTGPAIVQDPKCELYGMIGETRARMDHEVIRLGLGMNGFDTLAEIDTEVITFTTDVTAAVERICGPTPTDPRSAFFTGGGKRLVAATIMNMLLNKQRPARYKTMAEMRRQVAVGGAGLYRLLQGLATNSPNVVKSIAAPLKQSLDAAPEMFAGFTAAVDERTSWISDPAFAPIVSGDAFKATDLLKGNTDVILEIPDHVLAATPAVARCVIGSLMKTLYDANGKFPWRYLFLLDEMDALGKMDILANIRDNGRSRGITICGMLQNLGQLRERWGEAGERAWMGSAIFGFAAVSDLVTAEWISRRIGERGELGWSESRTAGRGRGGRSASRNISYSWQDKRLWRVEQIMNVRPTGMFVNVPGGGEMGFVERAIAFRRKDMVDQVNWPERV